MSTPFSFRSDGGSRSRRGLVAAATAALVVSPLAAIVASPANGRARFDGQIAWAPGSSTSHGTLSVERMDFVSPMGPVQGLAGRAEFSSLIPLTVV